MKLYAKKTTGNFPKRILTLEETKMILHPYLRDLLRYILCVTRKILHPIKCNLLIKCKVVTSQKRIYIDGRHKTLYFFTLRIFSTKTRIFFGKLRHPLVPRSKCFARYSTWKAKESSAVGWLWKGMEKKVSQAYDDVSMQNIKPIYKSSYKSPSLWNLFVSVGKCSVFEFFKMYRSQFRFQNLPFAKSAGKKWTKDLFVTFFIDC